MIMLGIRALLIERILYIDLKSKLIKRMSNNKLCEKFRQNEILFSRNNENLR